MMRFRRQIRCKNYSCGKRFTTPEGSLREYCNECLEKWGLKKGSKENMNVKEVKENGE